MTMRQRNVMCDDETWEALKKLAAQHRRSTAGEVRVALDVYRALVQRDGLAAVEEVLADGSRS